MSHRRKSRDELAHEAWAASRPQVFRCGICPGRPIVFEGPGTKGVAVMAAHREAEHPDVRPRTVRQVAEQQKRERATRARG